MQAVNQLTIDKVFTVLLTGYKGFIGGHLTSFLTSNGYNVVGVDRVDGNEVSSLTEEDIYGVDYVVHLAAQTSVWNKNYEQIINDNIISFMHIFDICKKLGKKFIYASSSCSINVTSAYGFSKMFDDIYAKGYGVGLRFHNVYGRESREDTLLGICLNNSEITLYNNGLNYRHFTYIDDVCKCIEKSFNLPDGLYNVVNPVENSVSEFVEEFLKYKKIKVIKTENKREADKVRQKIDDTHINLIDNPTSIEQGLALVFREN